jgi:hypothetical protein
MLKVINLYVIDMIFEEAQDKLSPKAKMLYINCIMHHFRNKDATVVNSVAFDMFEEDFGDFSKYRVSMQELHKAGLIEIGANKIAFHNKWGQHIDRSKLEKVTAEHYVAGFSFNNIEYYEKDLKSNQSVVELAQMKYKISKDNIIQLTDLFIQEQKAFDKKYSSFADCAKHFSYWLPNQIKQAPKEANKQVISKGKILGL